LGAAVLQPKDVGEATTAGLVQVFLFFVLEIEGFPGHLQGYAITGRTVVSWKTGG
jgi:hypothetical protein